MGTHSPESGINPGQGNTVRVRERKKGFSRQAEGTWKVQVREKRPIFPLHVPPLPECHTKERVSIAQPKLSIEFSSAIPRIQKLSCIFAILQKDG